MRRQQQRARHTFQHHASRPLAPAPGGRGSTNPRCAYAPLEILSSSAADASLSPRSHSASPASERGVSRAGASESTPPSWRASAATLGMCAAAPVDAPLRSDGRRARGCCGGLTVVWVCFVGGHGRARVFGGRARAAVECWGGRLRAGFGGRGEVEGRCWRRLLNFHWCGRHRVRRGGVSTGFSYLRRASATNIDSYGELSGVPLQ